MTETSTFGQPVQLSVPASTLFLAPARVLAASLGAEAGLNVDEIDDLRIGVNELMSLLVDGAETTSRVVLTVVAEHGEVQVEGTLDGPGEAAKLDELAERILSAVVDSYRLGASSFQLTKVASQLEPN